jgi:hypothetical protein
MRNVLALGVVVLFVGSVSVAVAQERLPQSSSGSGFGVGLGVGDVSGSANRVQTFDKSAFLERLSAPENIFGRVLAVDVPGHKIHLETGGSSHDEGRAGGGAMNYLTAYLDGQTNMEQIHAVDSGDDVMLVVREETTAAQMFGTGRKLVREVTVLRSNEKLAGFGGLGQRPDPNTERGIVTNSGSNTGGIVGQVQPGEVKSGLQTTIGDYTGAAPCWNCAPQPGWGDNGQANKSDYGTDATKPNLVKQ